MSESRRQHRFSGRLPREVVGMVELRILYLEFESVVANFEVMADPLQLRLSDDTVANSITQGDSQFWRALGDPVFVGKSQAQRESVGGNFHSMSLTSLAGQAVARPLDFHQRFLGQWETAPRVVDDGEVGPFVASERYREPNLVCRFGWIVPADFELHSLCLAPGMELKLAVEVPKRVRGGDDLRNRM